MQELRDEIAASAAKSAQMHADLMAQLKALSVENVRAREENMQVREREELAKRREAEAKEREDAAKEALRNLQNPGLHNGGSPLGGHNRNGELVWHRQNSVLHGYTYAQGLAGPPLELQAYMRLALQISLSFKDTQLIIMGQYALLPLAKVLPAPFDYECREPVFVGEANLSQGASWSGKFVDKSDAFSAMRNMGALAILFNGEHHPWSKFLTRFVEMLERMPGITLDDALNAWLCVMRTYFTSKAALSDPVAHVAALQINLLTIRNFALERTQRPDTSDTRAQGKGARGAPKAGRDRSRSREREEADAYERPRYRVCRDFNAAKGCVRTDCRYEHACDVCERPGHIRGSVRCRGRHT